MAIDLVVLRGQVREGVGRVSVAELSDALLDACITRAVRELAEYAPRPVTATLTTVAGQTIYNVSDLVHADPLLDPGDVLDIVLILADSWSHPSAPSSLGDAFALSLGSVTHPSWGYSAGVGSLATDTFLKRVEQEMIDREFPHEVKLMGDNFVIAPTPTAATPIALFLGCVYPNDAIPSRFLEPLLLKCKQVVADELITLRRGKFPGVKVGPSTVTIDVTELVKLRNKWEEEFKSRASRLPPVVTP